MGVLEEGEKKKKSATLQVLRNNDNLKRAPGRALQKASVYDSVLLTVKVKVKVAVIDCHVPKEASHHVGTTWPETELTT